MIGLDSHPFKMVTRLESLFNRICEPLMEKPSFFGRKEMISFTSVMITIGENFLLLTV